LRRPSFFPYISRLERTALSPEYHLLAFLPFSRPLAQALDRPLSANLFCDFTSPLCDFRLLLRVVGVDGAVPLPHSLSSLLVRLSPFASSMTFSAPLGDLLFYGFFLEPWDSGDIHLLRTGLRFFLSGPLSLLFHSLVFEFFANR